MKTFIFPVRQFSVLFALGLTMALLSSGCAHNKKLSQNLPDVSTTSEAEIQTESQAQSVSESTPPTIDDDAFDSEDDFFEDEFSSDTAQIADPLAPINRVIFQFNDKLYFWCLKPIAKGYRAVVPEPIRLGVGNMLYNVAGIGRMANCLFQGKLRAAGGELGRFFVNSTAGLLGLANPAANFPVLNPGREDLGQTLGTYGIGDGIYLVLPIYGPSTLRDTVGRVGDGFLNPFSYIDPWTISAGISAVNIINNFSFRIGDYEALKGSALDPYLLFRSGYIQKRRQMTKR